MENYELESDEVILFKDVVTHNKLKGKLQLTLTSRKIILEKEKGIVKKEKIKDRPQVISKGSTNLAFIGQFVDKK